MLLFSNMQSNLTSNIKHFISNRFFYFIFLFQQAIESTCHIVFQNRILVYYGTFFSLKTTIINRSIMIVSRVVESKLKIEMLCIWIIDFIWIVFFWKNFEKCNPPPVWSISPQYTDVSGSNDPAWYSLRYIARSILEPRYSHYYRNYVLIIYFES